MMKHEFTRVELMAVLVVLGIFGALAPGLGRLRAEAVKASCADRMRRIGEIAFLYAGANDDYALPHLSGRVQGWCRVARVFDPRLSEADFACPQDDVARLDDSPAVSYAFNTGHLWNEPWSVTNRKEWGTHSVLTGEAIRISRAPQPTATAWLFENHWRGNTIRNLWNPEDRTIWSTYDLAGYHEDGKRNNVLFLDGRVEPVAVATWVRGDNRGILFKQLHSPDSCIPNMK